MGSGRLITEAIKKYGKINFSKKLLEECSNITELMKREEYWLKYYKSIDKAEYNISMSGGISSLGNYWPYLSPEESIKTSNKLSKSLKNSEAHKNWAKKHHSKVKAENEKEREEIMKKHKNEVIKLYKIGNSMKNIIKEVKIPAQLIKRILVDNNQVQFDMNGHITRKQTKETKEKIAKTLEKYSLDNNITKYNYEFINSEEVQMDIKKMYEKGCSFRSIGRKYDVSGPRIAKILKKQQITKLNS